MNPLVSVATEHGLEVIDANEKDIGSGDFGGTKGEKGPQKRKSRNQSAEVIHRAILQTTELARNR
jgi:hypothetical protein